MVTEAYLSGGGTGEKFAAWYSVPRKAFREEASELLEEYRIRAADMVPVMVRFHLSDITNQAEVFRGLLAEYLPGVPVSLAGQPPVNGSRIAAEGWFADRALSRLTFMPGGDPGEGDSAGQMKKLFEALAGELPAGESVAENVLRTWIYCRDIDNNYAGLVRARREYFDAVGLTEKTHYIASTGIGGCAARPGQLVMMDALTVSGVVPGQIEYMHAPEHLSPTRLYGVTFERASRLISGDRSHYFISGTASIDKCGEIVHPGDVAGQTVRVLENVQALLGGYGGDMGDLKMATVYLRDAADRDTVEAILRERFGGEVPFITLLGTVCRPGWLVEMEGIAVNRRGDRKFPDFR